LKCSEQEDSKDKIDTESRSSERFWARIGGIFDHPTQLTKELLSEEFRKEISHDQLERVSMRL